MGVYLSQKPFPFFTLRSSGFGAHTLRYTLERLGGVRFAAWLPATGRQTQAPGPAFLTFPVLLPTVHAGLVVG